MVEVEGKDVPEIKQQEAQGFKEIKPQDVLPVSEAKQFWDSKFEDAHREDASSERGITGTEKNDSKDGNLEHHTESIEEIKEGGSYKEVKANSDSSTHEVHHMPADSVSPLDRGDGPAIKMEIEDHRKTASCGSSLEAREYQAAQREKIQNGDFRGAIQMDIDDIKEKFGNKYDKAIEQMLTYVDKLEAEGKIL